MVITCWVSHFSLFSSALFATSARTVSSPLFRFFFCLWRLVSVLAAFCTISRRESLLSSLPKQASATNQHRSWRFPSLSLFFLAFASPRFTLTLCFPDPTSCSAFITRFRTLFFPPVRFRRFVKVAVRRWIKRSSQSEGKVKPP